MQLPLSAHGTRVQQIVSALRRRIESGDLPAGSRLPGTRTLARDLGLSRGTVVAAYEQLEAEGYCEARSRSGTRVADLFGQRPSPPAGTPRQPLRHEIRWRTEPAALPWDLRFGLPNADDFPAATWARLVRSELRRGAAAAFDYPHPEGLPRLRQAVAAHLGGWRGLSCSPDDVLIVNGAQQAFGLIARALLPTGAAVAVEEPGYRGFAQAVRAAGLDVVPVAVDAEGIDVRGLAAQQVSAAYVTPAHQFPSGVILSARRRQALLAWAGARDAWIVEDDYDSAYRFDAPPLPSLKQQDDRGSVILVGSFSKTVFPDLRLGYVIAPPEALRLLALLKNLDDAGSSTFMQSVLAAFIEGGHYHRHLRRSLRRNAVRRTALIEALQRAFGDGMRILGAASGLHLVADLGLDPVRERQLVEAARRRGLGVHARSAFCQSDTRAPGLVLGFARLEPPALRRAVRELATAVAEVRGRPVRVAR